MGSAVLTGWESVGLPLDEAWIVSLEQKLSETDWEPWLTDPASIFRVPHHIRDDDAKLYDPKVVSLGPYHRDADRLLPMNRLKWHSLKKFLGRSTCYALFDYLRLIKVSERRARAAYADDLASISSNDFAQMMLLDGCFVVETILLWKIGVGCRLEAAQNPIASTSWSLPVVARDMLMLENQIPFFLLQLLFDYAFPRQLDFAECAVEFFAAFADMELELPPDGARKGSFCHLLHLFHSCINPRKDAGEAKSRTKLFSQANKSRTTRVKSIPSATRLSKSGVKFTRKRTRNMLDITFHNGKMQIPQLAVNGHFDTLFRNLIAFEQGYKCVSRYVTSYASLMDCIIDTPEDVTLLQKGEIIVNGLGNNQDVAALFNKLCSGAAIDDGKGNLASVFEDANRHYKRNCNHCMSILRRDYFGNPWSVIALMAAILLFILTSMQRCTRCWPTINSVDTTYARLPQKLRHPAHPTHLLTLRFLPNYASSRFLCDACGHDGDSFCYSCSQCDFDLHLPCTAALGSSAISPTPTLSTSSPTTRGEVDAASQWFYLCRAYDFGGHIVCFVSDDVHAPNKIAKGSQTEHVNMGQQLLDLQLQVQASMMTADIMVQGARAVANLALDSGPYQCSYYDSGPLPSQYAAMANSMVMNNLALLSINNTTNSRAATEPQS
ncbi:UPF0481 protein At3g47200-like [Zingiber officinale]|uniref:UPF0481 protein At3g47200-like n=1 Tax=Zingiber officinale TaxID=94328 RepID=UPI001C4DB56B|nr:UPF0481 protein At3g47200-like [Zingiber officinale]